MENVYAFVILSSDMSKSESPIHIQQGEDGTFVKILLLDNWYDTLKPIYDLFKPPLEAISITKVPEAFDEFEALFNYLIVEFEAVDWGFAIGLLVVLRLAAKKGIALGKFTYEHVGGLGEGGLGEMPMGGYLEIREL